MPKRDSANHKTIIENSENKKNKPCPICGGIGYVRRDLPVGHPQFGQLEICICRKNEIQKTELQKLYDLSNIDAFKAMTFDNFDINGHGKKGDSNKTLEVAFKTAQNFIKKLNGWLLLMGGYGCGKTHLASAIAISTVSSGIPTLFLTVPDLLDWLRSTFNNNETTYEDRFNEIRNIRLLVLDDLGTQNTTPWAREKLYQIINYRYIKRLRTVLTTNLSLNEIDSRISSRLQDKDLVTKVIITAPDYRNPLIETSVSPISSLSNLRKNRTFNKFSPRHNEKLSAPEQKSLDKAIKAAIIFAENPKGGILFVGKYRTGKTHLAAGIGNYRAGLGENPIFTSVPDLLDYLRATFSPKSTISYDKIFTQVRTANLLILDDLNTKNTTPWAREKLFQIFNYRYERELPTVITATPPIEDIDAHILSRLLDERICNIIEITVPPYRASKCRN